MPRTSSLEEDTTAQGHDADDRHDDRRLLHLFLRTVSRDAGAETLYLAGQVVTRDDLTALIERLPPRQRQSIRLHVEGALPWKRVVDELHWSRPTLQAAMSAGLDAILKAVERKVNAA